MQLSQAHEIANNSELNQQWQKLTEEEADLLMDHVEAQENRRECCFPYDCMHHEQCGDGYPCGACQRGQARWEVVEKVLEKFPEGYQYATALTRIGDAYAVAYQLQTVKDLEAMGDYAAAERIMEAE